MIKSIKIRNVATFNYEGVTIDNLQKVNVIYGSNDTSGSGHFVTITNYPDPGVMEK